jgi:hypothetical protein
MLSVSAYEHVSSFYIGSRFLASAETGNQRGDAMEELEGLGVKLNDVNK